MNEREVGAGSLWPFFAPKSIAIVGASGRPDNLFARPLHYLLRHGFRGDVYPINPKYPEIAGLRAFPDVAAVGKPIDLALLLVPAAQIGEQLRELAAAGVKAAVVFASGFAEAGEDGKALQDALLAEARRLGIRVLGPNCQGLIDASAALAATFTGAVERSLPQSSGVAYVGQSGAVGGSVLDLAREAGMGLAAWVSTGNEADVDSLEVAQFLLEREDVDTLMLYLESSPDASRYEHLGRTATARGKHVVCLRTGRSAAGRRAVASHTGGIVAPDLAFRLLSERLGVVLVDDLDDLVRVAYCLHTTPTPNGNAMAVVTTSGGAGSLAADVLSEHGWELPALSPQTRERLAEVVPDFGALANPVDVTAQLFSRSGRRFPEVCAAVLDDAAVAALAVLVTMATGDFGRQLVEDVVAVRDGAAKPTYFVWMAGRTLTAAGREVAAEAGLPVYDSVSDLARTLDRLRAVEMRAALPAAQPGPPRPPGLDLGALRRAAGADGVLTEWGGRPLLDAFGIPRPEGVLVTTPAEVEAAGSALEPPYACKLQSPALTHKADAGAVKLGVEPAQLGGVVAELFRLAEDLGLATADVEGVLVQPMAPQGLEVLVSALGSEQGFPPVVTVGFGGVTAELDPDVVSFLAPVAGDEVLAGLGRLRRGALLFGHRGQPPADLDALVDVVQAVSAAAVLLADELAELEINPLVVYPQRGGVLALDFVARLAPARPAASRP